MEEKLGYLKVFEEDLCGSYSIAEWVVWGFGEENGMFSRVYLQLLKNVSPNGLHVIPIFDDAVLNRVSKFDETAILLRSLSNKSFSVICVDHNSLVLRASHTIVYPNKD